MSKTQWDKHYVLQFHVYPASYTEIKCQSTVCQQLHNSKFCGCNPQSHLLQVTSLITLTVSWQHFMLLTSPTSLGLQCTFNFIPKPSQELYAGPFQSSFYNGIVQIHIMCCVDIHNDHILQSEFVPTNIVSLFLFFPVFLLFIQPLFPSLFTELCLHFIFFSLFFFTLPSPLPPPQFPFLFEKFILISKYL